jgi:hypothetical protein
MIISFIVFLIGLVITDNTRNVTYFVIGLYSLGYFIILLIIGFILGIKNTIDDN